MSPPKQTPVANLSSEKSAVQVNGYCQQTPPDLIDAIESRNRYDCELYRYGYALFAEQQTRQQAQPQRSYSIAPRLRHYGQQMLPLVARHIKVVIPQRVQRSKLRRVYQFVHRRLA